METKPTSDINRLINKLSEPEKEQLLYRLIESIPIENRAKALGLGQISVIVLSPQSSLTALSEDLAVIQTGPFEPQKVIQELIKLWKNEKS